LQDEDSRTLSAIADYLVRKSVWILGGDGCVYDIGYGGLDHVLASNRKVNILVLDTEVYSNTGGQCSKSTPLGAVAKFSSGGKETAKKDLALIAMSYGHVYVARVAFGARDNQTVQAFVEAENHPGPSLIIAYSPCISHGFPLANGLDQQKLAVETGHWPLLRHDPARAARGEPVTVLDSPPAKVPLANYTRNELRYQILAKSDPVRAAELGVRAQAVADARYSAYRHLAENGKTPASPASVAAPVANPSPTPSS
jgi:pyruvate-ferredoxin/flavodoxin oxidoreductase